MKRHQLSTDKDDEKLVQVKDPLRRESREAIGRIVKALKDLENMRQGLEDAKYNLSIAVDYAPSAIRQDFQTFWAAGGCNLEQYRAWLSGKRPDKVPRRQHLRLVINEKQVPVARYRPRQTFDDDGPDAA